MYDTGAPPPPLSSLRYASSSGAAGTAAGLAAGSGVKCSGLLATAARRERRTSRLIRPRRAGTFGRPTTRMVFECRSHVQASVEANAAHCGASGGAPRFWKIGVKKENAWAHRLAHAPRRAFHLVLQREARNTWSAPRRDAGTEAREPYLLPPSHPPLAPALGSAITQTRDSFRSSGWGLPPDDSTSCCTCCRRSRRWRPSQCYSSLAASSRRLLLCIVLLKGFPSGANMVTDLRPDPHPCAFGGQACGWAGGFAGAPTGC